MTVTFDFIVAANRLPVRWVASKNKWEPSPGGLVSAMLTSLSDVKPLLWVGWTGAAGETPAEFEETQDGMSLQAIPLSRPEAELYYEGMSNATIWPLYHDAVRPPEFHRTWWNCYTAVNQRFCDTICESAAPGAVVWVHDYHLQLVPKMLRASRPDLTIGFFSHIPFPPVDLFMRLPFRRQIMRGLLGADLVGFQTARSRDNFRRTAVNLGEVAKQTDEKLVLTGGAEGAGSANQNSANQNSANQNTASQNRNITTRWFPIGIDVQRFVATATNPKIHQRAAEIRKSVGSDKMILGVDRLDYTKGIDTRLRAFGELLGEQIFTPQECAMVQVAEPSRSNVNQYVELRQEVEQLVGKINGVHSQLNAPAIHYFHQSQPFEEIVALYLAADVMLVTPLRDGMNLVAKEYVAARQDNTGVLLLSEFTGAAEQLRDAVLVNPYDIDGLKKAMTGAVNMPTEEAQARMRKLREAVTQNDVHTWVRSFVECLRQASHAAFS